MQIRSLRAGWAPLALGLVLVASGAAAGAGRSAEAAPTPTVDATALARLGRLAFRWQGSLWIAVGGSVHRLGPGAYPLWSPSGRFIAYLAGAGGGPSPLVLARSDGRPVTEEGPTLTTDPGGYAWLPGSDRLVVAATGRGGGIRLVSPSDGRDELLVAVISHQSGTVLTPAGGNELVYGVTLQTKDGVTGQLDIRSLTGGPPRLILRVRDEVLEPLLVEAGRVLYWADPLGSASLAADGMGLYSVPEEGGRPVLVATTLGHRDWVAPGPAHTVYAVVGPGRIAGADKRLLRCSVETGRCLVVWAGGGLVPSDPAFDPRTGRLAFVLATDLGSRTWGFRNPADLDAWIRSRRLYVGDAAGRHGRLVARLQAVYAPAWAADHRHLVVFGTSGVFAVDTVTGLAVELAAGLTATEGDLFGFYGHRDIAADFAFVPIPGKP